jgi:hypothetical protein
MKLQINPKKCKFFALKQRYWDNNIEKWDINGSDKVEAIANGHSQMMAKKCSDLWSSKFPLRIFAGICENCSAIE